jgi:hypothetical protein
MAKGILFMADVVAALKHETIKTLGSTRLSTVKVKIMKLKNIINEILK